MKLVKKHQNLIKNIVIQLIFLAMAFLFIVIPLKSGQIFTSDDTNFNFKRIMEVFYHLKNLQWPQFTAYTDYPSGIATPTMYPWLILVPFSLLAFLIKKPVELWYTIIFISMFIGANISYFASRKLFKLRRTSLLFTVLFCMSTMLESWIEFSTDIGTYLAILLSPLAFFGWFYFKNHGHWKMMTLGLILVASSHVLVTIILVLTLLGMTFVCRHQFTHTRLMSGLRALGIFIVTSAIVWLPILVLLVSNQITRPANNLNTTHQMIFPNMYTFSKPYEMRVWSVIDLIAFIIFCVYWRYFSKTFRKLMEVLGVILFLNIQTVWTFIFSETPLSIFQFPFRADFVVDLILMSIMSIALTQVIPKQKFWTKKRSCCLLIFVLLILFGTNFLASYQLSDTQSSHSKQGIMMNLATLHQKHDIVPKDNNYNILHNRISRHNADCTDYFPEGMKQHFIKWRVVLPYYHSISSDVRINHKNDKKNHKNMLDIDNYIQRQDILNKPETKMYPSNVRVEYKSWKTLPIQYHKQGMIINTRKSYPDVLVPNALYNSQKYHITLNHKPVKYHKKYGAIVMPLHKGKNVIKVTTPIMWYRYVSFLISLVGLTMLIVSKKKCE